MKQIIRMKRLRRTLMILLMGGVFVSNATAQVNVPMHIIDKGAASDGSNLAPARPWYITQNDNVLTLPALADDYTLELRDENGVVVYSTFLPAGTTSVVLPSELSGEFELRLVADTYYYRGYIEL